MAVERLSDETPTLFEWAGGQAAIRRLIDAFYDRVEARRAAVAVLSRRGERGAPGPRRRVVVRGVRRPDAATPTSSAATRTCSPTTAVSGSHSEQRFRFASLMSLAADDAGLPDDPEFRAALVGYVEWGTRLAMQNSQEGAEVAEHAPVPRWGWGVAPPYQG